MSQFQKTQQTAGRFVIVMVLTAGLGVLAGWRACGGQGYLKAVGPAPLRFDLPDTNTLAGLRAVMQIAKLSVAGITNATTATNNMALQAVNPVPTNGLPEMTPTVAGPVPEVEAVTNRAVGLDTGNPGGIDSVNNNSGDEPSSARDLLPVATSMITEYLKSTKSQATNQADRPGATVFVPLQMGFTPPAMQGSVPVPESRAVYKSQ